MRRLTIAAMVMLAACAARPPVTSPPSAHAVAGPPPPIVASNILRRDYAGSKACEGCHADEYDKFMSAPMHNMTRLPTAGVPSAPFDGGSFHFKDDEVRFSTRGADRLMTIVSATQGTRTFRVTRVIGGHYREDFAGVEEGGRDTKTERILPATWFLGTRAWRYKGYSVMGPERPGLRPGGVWNRTCIFCHNTIPYFDDMLGAISDPKLGPYQGEVVDPLLPPERRARFEITDANALHAAVADEERVLGAHTPMKEAGDLLRAIRAKFDGGKLVEVGIGCESCHGGSIEHVRHNATKPSYEPRASFLRVSAPVAGEHGSPRAVAINRVCARCHQVLFTRYAWTWEGRSRHDAPPGGANINSGEARDFLLGGCAAAMACSDCHDPHAHTRPPTAELEARADGVCVRCHAEYATAEAQRAHTHHDPAGAGGRCIACHMPKKNMSLDNKLGRYHRIASPTETAKVEGDRPLECALCHGDKPVESLVATMEAWWHKAYDRARLRGLYGADLERADPLVETLARGKPHEQAVAMSLLGARGDKAVAPLIAAQLTHPIPILRYYAVAALEALLGAPAPLDVHANDDVIVKSAAGWLAKSGLQSVSPSGAPSAPPGAETEE
ncbi:MAG TPA: cytochrome c3 family protein [Polyangia bacterium]